MPRVPDGRLWIRPAHDRAASAAACPCPTVPGVQVTNTVRKELVHHGEALSITLVTRALRGDAIMMHDIDTQPITLNGRWRLDELSNELVDPASGASVALSPIAVRLLTLLADAPNTIVGRRQLFDQGWRRYGIEVCENSLNQVICALRTAFARLGPEAPSIRTVPRIGYSLVAQVAGRADRAPAAQVVAPDREASCETGDPRLLDRQAFDAISGLEWRRRSAPVCRCHFSW
ncbi:conserved hypothetical protein [Ricinus communis]|uniref:OmpR/PhoB-type domain-containing protein n=1 Tax=Ricinus communis TaxID=3988 RepID=B9TBN5_RICCO|nr:conserved hypothetical protein [Ricinus communis]